MIRVIALIRPHKLEEVKTAIAALGISGLTVNEARGTGSNPERSASVGGFDVLITLSIRSRLEVCAPADLQEVLIQTIQKAARTGEDGDGKIFVEPLRGAIRIRTGERDREAL